MMIRFAIRLVVLGTALGALAAQDPSPAAADPAAIADLVKAATAKLKGPALAEAVAKLKELVRSEVPAAAGESGCIASTRALAAGLETPIQPIANEFGLPRMVSAKTGKPQQAGAPDLFRPRTAVYRFGTRDYSGIDDLKSRAALQVKDISPADQLAWLLAGHTPEVELALIAIERDLDVDRSRDKLSRLLEYWRNGRESFYVALDRTAGTKDALFFYDAMLGQFVDALAPSLMTAKSLSVKHDRLHESFLTLREYRRLIEALARSLVSTHPLPASLKAYDYSAVPGQVQPRDAVELLLASHRGDIARAVADLKTMIAANPMPAELWGKYEAHRLFLAWCQAQAPAVSARIKAAEPDAAELLDADLAIRCRRRRADVEGQIRAVALRYLKERGIEPRKA